MNRLNHLDALRGLAVLMMILFHLSFDLHFFYSWKTPTPQWFAWMTASLFLMVMGVCFALSWERHIRARSGTSRSSAAMNKYLRRGLFIFSGGMLISLMTWMIDADNFVKFGILHLIGISAMIQPLFVCLRGWNLLAGCIVIIIGIAIHNFHVPLTTYHLPLTTFLFPLGLITNTFSSLDYYPLFPWFGVILLGMGIGSLLYAPKRSYCITRLDILHYPRWILWMGRRALWIYFFHQPIIMGLLALLLSKP